MSLLDKYLRAKQYQEMYGVEDLSDEEIQEDLEDYEQSLEDLAMEEN